MFWFAECLVIRFELLWHSFIAGIRQGGMKSYYHMYKKALFLYLDLTNDSVHELTSISFGKLKAGRPYPHKHNSADRWTDRRTDTTERIISLLR